MFIKSRRSSTICVPRTCTRTEHHVCSGAGQDSSRTEVFKDLNLSMYESKELVKRTTRQQEPTLEVKISSTRSMLKTIDEEFDTCTGAESTSCIRSVSQKRDCRVHPAGKIWIFQARHRRNSVHSMTMITRSITSRRGKLRLAARARVLVRCAALATTMSLPTDSSEPLIMIPLVLLIPEM